MAYGVQLAGSDRSEWRIKKVETGQDLTDILPPNRQGGISWLKDNSGFFYSGFPRTEKGKELKETTFGQKLYFHKLGSPVISRRPSRTAAQEPSFLARRAAGRRSRDSRPHKQSA